MTTTTPDTQAGELLLCPFDGRTPALKKIPSRSLNPDDDYWIIACEIYLNGGEPLVGDGCGVYQQGRTREEVIQRWNTRVDLPRATTADSILRPLCAEHPHVKFVEGVLGGVQPLIEGHRIGISHLLSRMATGMTLAEYQETWGFNDDVIKDAFAYAQDVIDALIDSECMAQVRAATQSEGKGE